MWDLIRFVLGFLFIVAARLVPAQGSTSALTPPASQLQAAAAAFARGDWPAALTAYDAISKAYPGHALSRFRVGVALMELQRYPEAERDLKEGERLGVPAGQAAYRLAQLFAEQHRADAAIAQLERAATAGFTATTASLTTDRHLATLTSHSKWAAVLDQFDAVIQPCRHDPRHREFDFWLGDWDVLPTGQSSGTPARNTVTLEDNGCVVTEHWLAPGGSEGQSFNIYDASYGEWRQTWVDNIGGQHDYRGGLRNGNMVYYGDLPGARGSKTRVHTRLTFFPIGKDSVRQFSEISNDAGKTWQTGYDLMYVRRKMDTANARTYAGPLTTADRAAMLAIDSTFVRAWLRDDTAAVLDLFAPDAVLIPPGTGAITGRAAIRSYWWPTDGSRTVIRSFSHTVTEVTGTRAFAFMRGTSELAWDYTKDGKTTSQTSRSSDVRLLAPDASGRWKVIRQIWVPLP